MVKRTVAYICEVCNSRHSTKRDAERCEKRKPGVQWPRGTIFGMPQSTRSHHETNLLFVVDETVVKGHYTDTAAWAFRDNGAGDSTGKERCGAEPSLGGYQGGPDPTHPTFKRAVAYLKAEGIDAKVWDGKVVRGLAAYRQAWNAGKAHRGEA